MDRRTYPRFSVSCPVRFHVDVLGKQFLVSEFSSNGTVLDISRKGLLAHVDRLFAVGTECFVSLLQAEQLVSPHQMRGRVRRSSIGDGGWRIGVEFESLVDVLPPAGRLTGAGEARTA